MNQRNRVLARSDEPQYGETLEEMTMFKTQFDRFVCGGDSISCEVDGVTFTARLEHDTDSHVDDAECYTKRQIAAWKADEWRFFGMVISAEIDGVCLGEHLASLWGIEGNFPSRRKNPNTYFMTVANELLAEAVQGARQERGRILQALAA